MEKIEKVLPQVHKKRQNDYEARLKRAHTQQKEWLSRLCAHIAPKIEAFFNELYHSCLRQYQRKHNHSLEDLYNFACKKFVENISDTAIEDILGQDKKQVEDALKITIQASGEVLALINHHRTKEVITFPAIVVFLRNIIKNFERDLTIKDLKSDDLHSRAVLRQWLERLIEHEVRDILPLDKFKSEDSSDEELNDAEDAAQRLSDEEEEEEEKAPAEGAAPATPATPAEAAKPAEEPKPAPEAPKEEPKVEAPKVEEPPKQAEPVPEPPKPTEKEPEVLRIKNPEPAAEALPAQEPLPGQEELEEEEEVEEEVEGKKEKRKRKKSKKSAK
jgi:chemotaxis protein histidine kinase CheA